MPLAHVAGQGPRPPVYRPRPGPFKPAPTPIAPPPVVAAPVATSNSLASLVPSTTGGLLLCLAALLSAGFLVRTLHPRYKYRINPRGNKNRATVIQKIIAKQEATKADSAVERAGKSPSRSRSNSLGRARSVSASVAATSAAIVSGLSKLTTATSNAIASTSHTKLDSEPAGSAPRQMGREGKGAALGSSGAREDAFSSGVGRLLSADSAGKKNRGKKGKGAGTTPSQGASLAVSPLGSPARRPSLQDGEDDSEPTPVFEVSTQTTFPLDPPPVELTTTTALTPTSTTSQDNLELPLNDPTSSLDQEPHPRPSTPPQPPPAASTDATVQTSPRLSAPPLPPPALPKPFDLHASFQSTPPVRPPSPTRSAYSHQSPPLSPSPSRRLSALPHGSPRRPTPSPTEYLSSVDPSSSNNSASPSPVAARSRKQARKASAAAASGSTAQQSTVVGMPRAPRSRDPTDESQEMNGEEPRSSPRTSKPQLLRVDTSSSRLSNSSEHSAVGSEKGKGKEKEREFEVHSRRGSGTMSSGKGRHGVPPPIPIPPSPTAPIRQPSDQRRLSSSTSGNSNSAGSTSTSPYLSHQILMTMTPPDTGRRKSVTSGSGLAKRSPVVGGKEEDERFWREDEQESKWAGGIMGLAIELDDVERRRLDDGGSTGSRGRRGGSRDGRETVHSWSSTGGSSSPNLQSLSDSYFPPPSHTALTSPESSPHPPSRQLLPLTSTSTQRPWSPQLMAAEYRMIPHPSAHSASTTPQIPPPPPPPIPSLQSHGGGGNSRSSRQTGLSVPSGSQQQQQAAHLQQQQAYAFYAHAQAQYQHVIALQLQAQQHQQRQQQQAAQQQQQQLRQRHDSEHSLSNGLTKAPPTPTGLVYPISGTSIPPPPPPPQTPQSMAHASGWGSVPPSPGHPGSHFGMSSTISPTSATFPSSATSSSYSHQHQLPSVQPNMSSYYLGSPAGNYLNNYSMSPQMPPLPQRQSSSGKRGSNGGGGGGGGNGDKMKSPRPGADRARSASAATLTTLSSTSGGGNGVVSDATGWKIKVRTAEMEADRSAKELEIARWRLSVLEEEQRAIEHENQEALRALATRAMRAEARIKLLEEARVQDSSSASGSSPATRPSSIAGSSELPQDLLPPPVASLDDADSSARDSPPGVKVHPLAWLDLDSVAFNARAPPNVRPAASSPSMRRKSGRSSGEWKMSRKSNGRRRSNHGFPSPTRFDDEEEEEVLIVLDAPHRRKSLPRASNSRRSSFLGDEFSFDHETSSVLDEDELSNLDDDEARSLRGEPTGTSEYCGYLPAYLKASSSTTSRPPSINGSASPRVEPMQDVEEEQEEDRRFDAEAEREDDTIVDYGRPPQLLLSPVSPDCVAFSLPPSIDEETAEEIPSPSPPEHSTTSSSESTITRDDDLTPRIASLPSPPADEDETVNSRSERKTEEESERYGGTPEVVGEQIKDTEISEKEQAAEVEAPKE